MGWNKKVPRGHKEGERVMLVVRFDPKLFENVVRAKPQALSTCAFLRQLVDEALTARRETAT